MCLPCDISIYNWVYTSRSFKPTTAHSMALVNRARLQYYFRLCAALICSFRQPFLRRSEPCGRYNRRQIRSDHWRWLTRAFSVFTFSLPALMCPGHCSNGPSTFNFTHRSSNRAINCRTQLLKLIVLYYSLRSERRQLTRGERNFIATMLASSTTSLIRLSAIGGWGLQPWERPR